MKQNPFNLEEVPECPECYEFGPKEKEVQFYCTTYLCNEHYLSSHIIYTLLIDFKLLKRNVDVLNVVTQYKINIINPDSTKLKLLIKR